MLYVILAIILLSIDQLTKHLTVNQLAEFESVPVIESVLSFTRYHNTGGPWSLFDGIPALFVVATFAIFAFEIWYLRKHELRSKTGRIACAMINSGAIGNLIDRIFRGYVVDMIEVKFIDYPIFNFADCCIVVGCVLLCIYVIFYSEDNNHGKHNTDM